MGAAAACYTNAMTTISAEAQLEELRQRLLADNPCPELAASATQLVFGVGSSTADIMLIGEAPGAKEDQRGEPFVGASGKFLDEMCSAAGLQRSDVYITNIVKYRPPHNRDPLPEEKVAFWPYLAKQIHIIQPRVILPLGRHSGTLFVPGLRISHDHGQPVTVNVAGKERLIIPLYHPAAALYRGDLRSTLLADFVQAAQLARQATQE